MNSRENVLAAYRHEIPEYVPLHLADSQLVIPDISMDSYDGKDTGFDEWGVSWTYEPHIGGCMASPGVPPLLEDIADWKEVVKFPNLTIYDWASQAAKDQADYDETKAQISMMLIGPFERLHALMGIENALIAMVTDPESCLEFFNAVAYWKAEQFKYVVDNYHVDVIMQHDDYGGENGMLCSPQMWRELLKPSLRIMVEATHELGCIYEHHSDGVFESVLEDMIEVGCDAINPLQPCNKSIKGFKKKYERQITFVGGFDMLGIMDSTDHTISEDDYKAEYHRVLNDFASGGSFISHPMGAAIMIPKYIDSLMEEHFTYGYEFYKNESHR